MRGSFTQQRSVMGKGELRTELELLLTEDVSAGPGGEPDNAQLRKASTLVDKVLALVDRYLQERGVRVG